ncbi:DUF1289 domain-containing protein [Fulvimarina sp. 2208YS6-2-32]|uniref:DUF1289 domain-containing protein n=1 Tax=Fulvimarina uroteuthidis TaxID=3098149 RepID=A0ABU5I7H9_9HYPH|nr:DUF1289 domain-containing protein [Fulvimarina sp. 2208YS6-2-32]MDY8110829.1 DUF1289 domain-containing protein [Fulvimarina sp. 2208YS6-2-32]
MAGLWRKAPSPCIGICKRPGGICVGCGMTKADKKTFKRRRSKGERKALFRILIERLDGMGRLARWEHVYRRRCDRKDRPCPLDKL